MENSIKVYAKLRADKINKEGEHLICINVLLNGIPIKQKSTKLWVAKNHWDEQHREVKTTFAYAPSINKAIQSMRDEVRAAVYETLNKPELTKQDIKDAVEGNRAKKQKVVAYFTSYIDYIEAPRKGNAKKNAYNTIKKWKRERNRLKAYDPDVTFSQITVKWLEKYEAHCAQYLNNETSLPVTMRLFMEILNRADREGLFDLRAVIGYNRPMYYAPQMPYLTIAQTDTLLNNIEAGKYDLMPELKIVGCYFLIECFAGIRFSDWGGFTSERIISRDALKVRTTKTGADIYARLDKSPRLQRVVNLIKENNYVFDFPETKTNKLLKIIGGHLKCRFPLTTHVGRHTCATLLLEIGHTREYIAELLGVSIKTVDTYAKVTGVKMNNEYEKLGGL